MNKFSLVIAFLLGTFFGWAIITVLTTVFGFAAISMGTVLVILMPILALIGLAFLISILVKKD